jgi:hypothetical protein
LNIMDGLKAVILIAGAVGGVWLWADGRYWTRAEAAAHEGADKAQFQGIGRKIDTGRLYSDKRALELEQSLTSARVQESMTRDQYGVLDRPGKVTLQVDQRKLDALEKEIEAKNVAIDEMKKETP